MYLLTRPADRAKVFEALSKRTVLANYKFNEKVGVWHDDNQQVASITPIAAGADIVIVGDVITEGAEVAKVIKEYSIPRVYESTLYNTREDTATRLVEERSGVYTDFRPLYFLHSGRLICQVYDDVVHVIGFGDKEVLKHAVALTSILQRAVLG